MSFDFNKFLTSTSAKRHVDPVDLFQSLKVIDPKVNDLWLAQGDALRLWHAIRDHEDVAIVLNTGAGKTMIGVITAQSLVNETNDHVLYVCSSIQLVEQTAKKAEGYGLKVTTYYRSDFSNTLYQRGQAPCVTTYHALLNGKSRFLQDLPSAIIFDDAHTVEHLLRDAFSIKIRRETFPKAFSQIVELFRRYYRLIRSGVGYEETKKQRNGNNYWFVPPFALYEQYHELERILLDADLDEELETLFSWEHLKNYLDICALFISGQEIVLTPPVIPVSTIPYFQKGIRRLYLSATLTAGDKFMRTFGRVPEIVTPKTTAGECERLILIPSMHSDCLDDVAIAKSIIREQKALILVPSYRREAIWSDVLTMREKDNITEKIETFKTAETPEKMSLVSRYDGIDFPDKDCRVMVIDDLPSSLNPLEKFFWEKLGLAKYLRSAISSRIIQAFGRISRGMSDYGVVIITSQKLRDWLLEPKNRATLPLFLVQQLELGMNISEDTHPSELEKLASRCLKRNPDWLNLYNKQIQKSNSDVESTTDPQALRISQTEFEFGQALWRRDYEGAARCLSQSLEETFEASANTAAWHLLWLGYCFERLGQKKEAYEAYQRAHNIAHNIPPLHLQDWSNLTPELPNQVLEVARYLYSDPLVMQQSVPKTFDLDLAVLDGTGSPDQIEESLRLLGQYLGLMSTRPEKEFGTGPDVFWDGGVGTALCLEVKSDKQSRSSYIKKDLGQLRDHQQWVRNHSEAKTIYTAFVGLLLPPSLSSNPDPDMDVIELKEFKAIAQRLRAALEDICTQALPSTLPQKIFEVFKQRDLLWPELYRNMEKSKLQELGEKH
ncbi:DEAD-like helicase [Gloeothece citriformis PCC 7424]|uniref:DEAD-like helicase n=1 Tax=Gloeothece citriformis (strain PCC 7424) TaxID=65393 RepID=B7KJ20_GLOC7|nr:DEAD/DEAH box helicase family protein [Gloeothece citriformis]ACK70856.1 DEAD-like helicase [Gloeothece citriformis PCC 7424]